MYHVSVEVIFGQLDINSRKWSLNFVHAKIKMQINTIKYISNKRCAWDKRRTWAVKGWSSIDIDGLLENRKVGIKILRSYVRIAWIVAVDLFQESTVFFYLISNRYNNWSMDYIINVCALLNRAVDVSRRVRALMMNESSISVVIQQSRWSKRRL